MAAVLQARSSLPPMHACNHGHLHRCGAKCALLYADSRHFSPRFSLPVVPRARRRSDRMKPCPRLARSAFAAVICDFTRVHRLRWILTVCATCGGGMMLSTGTSKGGRVYRYYTCSNCATKGAVLRGCMVECGLLIGT